MHLSPRRASLRLASPAVFSAAMLASGSAAADIPTGADVFAPPGYQNADRYKIAQFPEAVCRLLWEDPGVGGSDPRKSYVLEQYAPDTWICWPYQDGVRQNYAFDIKQPYLYAVNSLSVHPHCYPNANWQYYTTQEAQTRDSPRSDAATGQCYCDSTSTYFERSVQWCVNKPSPRVQARNEASCKVGDGVSAGSGEFEHHDVDSMLGGFPLGRHYRFRWTLATPSLGAGMQWSYGIGVELEVPQVGDVKALSASRTTVFHLSSGTYQPTTPTADSLQELKDSGGKRTGWRYTDASANSVHEFNAQGLLLRASQAQGGWVDFSYSNATTPSSTAALPGVMIEAREHTGRSVRLKSGYKAIEQVALPGADFDAAAGSTNAPVRHVFNESASVANGTSVLGQLTSVIRPDGNVRRLYYERPRYAAGVTGITDETGQRILSNTYDDTGRVTEQTRTAGTDVLRQRLDYTTNTDKTRITDPLGSVRDVSVRTLNGRNLLTAQSQPAGAGCAAATSATSHDANGNPAVVDDFNGNRRCLVHAMARNLPTTEVEGMFNTADCTAVTDSGAALPAGSRKTSTQWHAQWSLPVRQAEPGRLTTWVYNGQADPFNGGAAASCAPATALLPDGKPIAVLCKRVEQATTDADGSKGFSATLDSAVPNRVWTTTYNAFGQVLTARGPRTDVDDTTTLAYYADTTPEHTLGDLKSVTRANGKTLSYPLYDKRGKVLRSLDENGLQTDYAYDLRDRLVSIASGSETTSIEYHANGLLKRITTGDGTSISYAYDAAQRLMSISDTLGNRIDYTLDAAGNTTAEKASDPGGSLRRQMSQVMDTLGRVQQATGRN